MKQIFLIASLALFSFNKTDAQTRQKARINQGVRSGEITKRERAVIAAERQDVRVAKDVALSDGRVTVGERRAIQREKRQASRAIYRVKHNNRTRR